MLVIKRVPTVVSLNQEENTKCGRECLGSCCVAGSRIPVYCFHRRYFTMPDQYSDARFLSEFVPDVDNSDSMDLETPSTVLPSALDYLITSQWDDRTERGLFRYDVTSCQSKVLPGQFGFVAQLNEGRHSKKRPTEFRVDQVLQDFDPKKFNFTKAVQEEALFCFEQGDESRSRYYPSVPVTQSPNIVLINVSPIDYGHILLVPRVLDCIPQRICDSTLLLAIHLAMEVNNPHFRVGYNSLGAFATINHLHFQAYYLEHSLPIEKASSLCVLRNNHAGGLRLGTLHNYPVRAMVYESGFSVDELAAAVAAACRTLQESNIPFNLLISDCGKKIFLIPQCYAEKQAKREVPPELLDMQVNPAVWEISGHVVLKRSGDYEAVTEEGAWDLLAEVSLPRPRFDKVKEMCVREARAILEKPLIVDSLIPMSPNLTISKSAKKGFRCLNPLNMRAPVQVDDSADQLVPHL